MEWIKAIIEKNTDADGKVDMAKAMAEVNAEFPKNAVPKETFNQKNDELKATNKLVEDLKTVDADGLQSKIAEHEATIAKLEADRAADKRTFDITMKLKEYGATDIDYMLYKLGDADIEDLDNKIKEFKEKSPTLFAVDTVTDETKDTKGFTVIDSKLEDGQTPSKESTIANEFNTALGL